VSQIWILEADVGWSGSSLVDALASVAPPRKDLVAYELRRARSGWPWFSSRNWLRDDEVWTASRRAARYSTRLLDALVSSYKEGRVAHATVAAPSVCMRRRWCEADACWGREHPVTGRDASHDDRPLLYYDAEISWEQWRGVLRRDAAVLEGAAAEGGPTHGRLYHKLKF